MPQCQDFAVNRVHRIQGLPQLLRLFVPNDSLAGRRDVTNEPRRQRNRRSLTVAAAMKLHFLSGISFLHAKVRPMRHHQSLPGHLPSPNKERNNGIFQIRINSPCDLYIGVLQNICSVHSPIKSTVHPKVHHPFQLGTVLRVQICNGLRPALPQRFNFVVVLVLDRIQVQYSGRDPVEQFVATIIPR